MVLFAAEWLWVRPDPGWGAWLAGSTLTVLCGLLIRHEIDLVAQLRAAQAGLAEQARAEERNRIARELHDVIGHTLTVSLLHVQSARLAVEHDPADAARALAEAERLGRECLAEVRHDGRDAPRGRRRRRQARHRRRCRASTGCPRWWSGSGRRARTSPSRSRATPAGLPATTGLAVYRIAQEALTNAAKHAPGAPTAVRLAVGAGRGDADRGQRGRAGHRHRAGRGQHARARRIARRHLRGGPGRPGLAGAGHAPARRVAAGRREGGP